MRTQPFPAEISSTTYSKPECNHSSTRGGRIFIILLESALESSKWSCVFLVAAVASYFFLSCTTVPFLAISSSVFLTNTVVKFIKDSSNEFLIDFITSIGKDIIFDFEEAHPYRCHLGLIVSLAISPFSAQLSVTTAVVYGVYLGLRIPIDPYLGHNNKAVPSLETITIVDGKVL